MNAVPEGEAPQAFRAFRRQLARMSREADTRLAVLNRRAAAATGRRRVAAEPLPMPEAILHPALGPHVLATLAAAYGSALGLGDGLMAECLCCRAAWAPDRAPVAAVRITTTKPDAMMVALAYGGCVGLGEAGFGAALGDALRRDFLGGAGEVSPAAFAPGGRA